MKKILIILLCLPNIGFSQNSDKFNLDIARELGHCYDSLDPRYDPHRFHHTLCSDSNNVRVFFLEPNYYCVYNAKWGGSAGSDLNFYKKENKKYVRLINYALQGYVDIHQEEKDCIMFKNDYKKDLCYASYTSKIKVINDTIYNESVTEYNHVIYGDIDFHNNYKCKLTDSLWLLQIKHFKE